MTEVASAFVSLMPSARGFGSKLSSEISGDIDGAGKSGGSRFGKVFMTAGAAGAALGVGSFIKGAVGLEAEFSQTINTIGAVANVGGAQLEGLSDLALQMGRDTSFSASEASAAMLELAKGGMSAATIKAGALAGTLQLAAAGGTNMETAATIASNAMNAFSIEGRDMASVAAALAGGANASSASIESLGQGLSQVGPGAVNAGLSLNETVATLSAFDAAGIKGSDAGTSLKTMLTRLIPSTTKASKAMDQLGLDFVKGNGSFESVTNIAGQLQSRLGGLTEAQRSQALSTIFGSDASRAAAVLMKEGSAGIQGFIKATEDQDAAQRAADARMKGTAGSIEAFKGSVETAQIELGLFLGPAIQRGFGLLTAGVNSISPAMSSLSVAIGPLISQVASSLAPAFESLTPIFATLSAVIGALVAGPIVAMATSIGGSLVAALSGLMAAIASPVVLIGALAGALVFAYTHVESFRNAINSLASGIVSTAVPILKSLAAFFTGTLVPAVTAVVTYVASALMPIFTQIANIITTRVLPILSSLAQFFVGKVLPAVAQVVTSIASKLKPVFDQLVATFQGKVLPAASKLLAKFQEWQPTIQKVVLVVVKIVGKVLEFAAAILGKVLPVVIRFAGFLIGNMVSAITGVIGVIVKIVGKVIEFGGALVGAVGKAGQFLSGVKDKVGAALTFVGGIPGKVTAFFANAGTLLLGAGGRLMDGLRQGIENKINDAINAVKAGLDKIKGLLPGSPIKWGPLKGWNGGTPGRLLMEMLAKGLAYGSKSVQAEMTKVAEKLGSSLDGLKSKFSSLQSDFASIADGVAGAFNPDMFGAIGKAAEMAEDGVTVLKPATTALQEFMGGLSGNNSNLNAMITTFDKLKGLGASKEFLSGLMSSGNMELATQLAADPAQLQKAVSLFDTNASLASTLGSAVATNELGPKMESVRSEIAELRKDLKQLLPLIAKDVEKGAEEGTRKGNDERNKDTKQRGRAGR